MIIRIVIGVLILLIVAGGIFAGVQYWKKQQEAQTSPDETEVALIDEALTVPDETEGPEADIGPELPSDETASRAVEAPTEAGTIPEEPVDLSTDEPEPLIPEEAPDVPVSATEPAPRPTRPVESVPDAGPEVSEITVEKGKTTPTPKPKPTEPPAPTPVPTTPVVTPTPTPASGNYSVRTLVPVLESRLQAVRSAMQRIGVSTLQEQKTGQQQRIQAYRVAIGYFRTKSDATSWARTYFRPKGIEYFVYPVQGMYSIQVGVYTQQQNVDRKMRELYRKFPGWRLPNRVETTSLTRSTYHLSIGKITEMLARKVQDTLVGMGIQAELAGI